MSDSSLRRATVATLSVAVFWLLATASTSANAGEQRGRLARSIAATDTAHLHRVRHGGEAITEEGRATGTIPGRVVVYVIVGPTVEAKFTIYASTGAISGHGSGKLKGRSDEPSFAGTMTVTRGTGRYTHVHGHGGFYGTLNRSSYKMVVQTTGTLSY
jgi:hypothetical protein